MTGRTLATVVAVGMLVAPMAAASIDPPEGADGGRIIFRQLCASCHGKKAHGDGPVADSLKKRPKDLTAIRQRNDGEFPVEEIAEFIDGRKWVAAHGPREMPVWGQELGTLVIPELLREVRIAEAISMLVDYLITIQDYPQSQ